MKIAICISVVVLPNFNHFDGKIDFKRPLESFAPVNQHLRADLAQKHLCVNFKIIFEIVCKITKNVQKTEFQNRIYLENILINKNIAKRERLENNY